MKILIAEACLVIALGAEFARHADVNESVDVSKDDALFLARSGRAFLESREDDPTKGSLTATEEDRARLAKQAKAIAASQKEVAARTQPTDFATMMADGIARGIAEGIKAAQAAQAPAPAPAPAGGAKT